MTGVLKKVVSGCVFEVFSPLYLQKMPLVVDDTQVGNVDSVKSLLARFPHFKESAADLCSQPVRTLGTDRVLYVNQREYAATGPSDDVVQFIGSEDATTCHIAVLRHTGCGVSCVAHFDGTGTREGIRGMMGYVGELSHNCTEGRLELHLVGGFCDDRCMSEQLTVELIEEFNRVKDNIYLKTACVSELNNVVKGKVHWPIIYGLAVDVRSGEIFPAKFTDKGPDQALRHARSYTGKHEMLNIYDPTKQELNIGPFQYRQFHDAHSWLEQPDHIILKYLSTSPLVEPPDFVENTRAALKFLLEHPHPGETVFPGGRGKVYRRNTAGQWELAQDS
ncbi:PREDICTED: protein N-terminal asparagine amidohydrolase-like isoform X1 [Branchiostoma belcheri]|uniref:Protein N-terminal asparagine amidohydrolase-like isoform X1 n=1 Tax=Branchiostoma belcheri TaxID=7741 RepID=A0A6P5AQI7_BRABE|nr:PREDICTED: protein N-terminal asparagine amidohydrolase-like isoform X1 [Branchiostoma belcheri]